MKVTTVAGIDPALDVSGVVIYRPETREYRAHTVTGEGKGPARQVGIRNRVVELIKPANLVAIEGYFFSEKYGNASELGELHGVLRCGLYEAGKKFVVVQPLWLKQYATGQTKATKDEIRLAVYKRWGIEEKTHDQVEAFVLAKIAASMIGFRKGTTAFQREVIEKVMAFNRQ